MQHILIPTDLTLYSLKLIQYAVHLLKGEPCRITLVHPLPVPDSITELLLLARAKEADQEPSTIFISALERLKKVYALEIHSLELEYSYCDSSSQLHQLMTSRQITLVLSLVPVTWESATISRFNTWVQQVPCPVLYIPDFTSVRLFRKIAFVLEADEKTGSLPDSKLLQLLCRHEYHLTFLLLFTLSEDTGPLKSALDRLYASPALAGITYSVHLLHERDRSRGVVSFLHEHEVDLVVTGKRRKGLVSWRLQNKAGFSIKTLQGQVPHLALV